MAPADPPASRVVSCDLVLEVHESAEVVLQVVAAPSAGPARAEFTVEGPGGAPPSTELHGPDGTVLHVLEAPRGRLVVHYRAAIADPGPVDHRPGTGLDRQVHLRPSRYCPSDHLTGFAVAEFGAGAGEAARIAAITDWIHRRVGYVPGSSDVHDSAEDTLLTGTGTCRDFAHLGIALCRATGIPARFASVYAPGLSPMDFHAVFEAYADGRWTVHDPTGLAPRQSMVRVATGRDAADAAFVAVTAGLADLGSLEVTAVAEPTLPVDDHTGPVVLA